MIIRTYTLTPTNMFALVTHLMAALLPGDLIQCWQEGPDLKVKVREGTNMTTLDAAVASFDGTGLVETDVLQANSRANMRAKAPAVWAVSKSQADWAAAGLTNDQIKEYLRLLLKHTIVEDFPDIIGGAWEPD